MTVEEESRFLETLRSASAAVGVPLDGEQEALCLEFLRPLLALNAQMNLTRITEPEAMAVKHFADSLTVLAALPVLPDHANVIDVGTGAGFPGMVLKIVRRDIRITLLDSLSKRLTFLERTAAHLGLTEVRVLHARVEDAGRMPEHRDHYDLVTARAVAALPTLLEWCGPLVRVGGTFVAMKGANADEEWERGRRAADLLELKRIKDVALTLPLVPGDEEPGQRHLLVFRKLRPTGRRFPRRTAEIKAQPL